MSAFLAPSFVISTFLRKPPTRAHTQCALTPIIKPHPTSSYHRRKSRSPILLPFTRLRKPPRPHGRNLSHLPPQIFPRYNLLDTNLFENEFMYTRCTFQLDAGLYYLTPVNLPRLQWQPLLFHRISQYEPVILTIDKFVFKNAISSYRTPNGNCFLDEHSL